MSDKYHPHEFRACPQCHARARRLSAVQESGVLRLKYRCDFCDFEWSRVQEPTLRSAEDSRPGLPRS